MSEELKHKLSNFEPEPPAGCWDRISSALDSGASPVMVQKLYGFEAIPPAQTWDKISAAIGKGENQVAPVRKINLKRFIAAASLIAIAVISILYWNREEPVTATATLTPAAQPAKKVSPQQKNDTEEPATPALVISNQETEPPVIAKNDNGKSTTVPVTYAAASSRQRAAIIEDDDYLPVQGFTHSFIPQTAESRSIAVSRIPLEKYMVYSTDEGDAYRVPKKLFNFLNCVRTEIFCQQLKQHLQQKMASNVGANDFTGLLEILRNLKENQ